MLNFRKAPFQFALEIERRLEKTHPGARLVEDSVKLVSIPGAHYDATVFIVQIKNTLGFVAELAKPDVPHIYCGHQVQRDARRNAELILAAILGLSERIRTDARFQRSRVISLNGAFA